MNERALLRIGDVKRGISSIRALLSEKTFEDIERDGIGHAALERFLEIVSEASRHLPDAWKSEHQDVAWRRLADLGNVLRHAYDRVDLQILWGICERELDPLEDALDAMLASHAPKGPLP